MKKDLQFTNNNLLQSGESPRNLMSKISDIRTFSKSSFLLISILTCSTLTTKAALISSVTNISLIENMIVSAPSNTELVLNYANRVSVVAPTLADYQAANIAIENEDDANRLNEEISKIPLGTIVFIGRITKLGEQIVAARAIRNYAIIGKTAPSAENYNKFTELVFTTESIAKLHKIIEQKDPVDVSDLAKITALIQEFESLEKIIAYRNDQTNPALIPNLEVYEALSGAYLKDEKHEVFLAEFNALVLKPENNGVDTVEKMKEIVSLQLVKIFVRDHLLSSGALSDKETFLNLGVSGFGASEVENDLLFAEIKKILKNESVLETEFVTADDVRKRGMQAVALIKIKNYAKELNQAAPELTDYSTAGIINVTATNITAVNEGIKAATYSDVETDQIPQIQKIVDKYIARLKINTYATTSGSPEPQIEDYKYALAITATTDTEVEFKSNLLTEVNEVVKIKGITLTFKNDIVKIIEQAEAIWNIKQYAKETVNTVPTIETYKLALNPADEKKVTAGLLDYINAAIKAKNFKDLLSLTDIENIVNSIYDRATAVEAVKNYVKNGEPVPSIKNYNIIYGSEMINQGDKIGVDNYVLAEVKYNSINALPTLDEQEAKIKGFLTTYFAINTIKDFIYKDGNAPTVETYDLVLGNEQALVRGSISENTGNINQVNTYIKNNKITFEFTPAGILEVVEEAVAISKIIKFANKKESTAEEFPTVEDYKTAKILGITAGNLDEINDYVKSLFGTDREDLYNGKLAIEKGIAPYFALEKVKTYSVLENPTEEQTPTVKDYKLIVNDEEGPEISGNLNAINAIIIDSRKIDVDTREEILKIINIVNSVKVIKAYANTNVSDKPTLKDYENIGLDVSSINKWKVDKIIDQDLKPSELNSAQEIVTAVNKLLAIDLIGVFAENNTSTVPVAADYETAGVIGVNGSNLRFINELIDAVRKKDVDTTEQIQTIANKGIAIGLIVQYSKDDANPAPQPKDFEVLDIDGVTLGNIEKILKAIADSDHNEVNDINKIKSVVNAALSTEAYELTSTNIYPNPSTGIFNVESATDVSYEIYDVLGRKLATAKLNAGSSTIDLTNQATGLYILKLATEDSQTKIIKLIKK